MQRRLFTALLLLTLSASFAFAQHTRTPPTPAQMVANKVAHLTALLTLTTAQQAEATTIFTTEQTSLAAIAPAMKTARAALKTAVQANELSAITTESSQIGALTGQETLAQSTANAQFYATLTAEQQTKYNKSGGGRGGRGGFGPQARRH